MTKLNKKKIKTEHYNHYNSFYENIVQHIIPTRIYIELKTVFLLIKLSSLLIGIKMM